ncbi:hypothetical protein [Paraburkholderia sp. UCT2]|uniref:hypothetical protein n=1 Tax=Paraburkholderia sp. UCT2 TaxID=2615208 RepID=UPI001654D451
MQVSAAWLGDAVPVEQLAAAVRARWSARDDRYPEPCAIRRKPDSGKVWPTVRVSLVGG